MFSAFVRMMGGRDRLYRYGSITDRVAGGTTVRHDVAGHASIWYCTGSGKLATVNMSLLGARAGLSISECVGLRWSDIDLATGQLALQPSHERRGQTVLLPSDVVDALRALPRGGGENVLGFASDVRARQRMKQLCNRG